MMTASNGSQSRQERAGVARTSDRRFLLDEALLRRMADILREYSAKTEPASQVAFLVTRADDSYYESRAIEDVLNESNGGRRGITELTLSLQASISVHGLESGTAAPLVLAFVTFDRKSSSDYSIRLSIRHSDRDWCFLLADALDEQIERTYRKVLPLLRYPTFIDLSIAFLAVLTSIFYTIRVQATQMDLLPQASRLGIDQKLDLLLALSRHQVSSVSSTAIGLLLALIVMMLVILLRPAVGLASFLNRSVFYWSDAIAVEDRTQQRISNCVWIIGIGLIVSVLAGVILNTFMKH